MFSDTELMTKLDQSFGKEEAIALYRAAQEAGLIISASGGNTLKPTECALALFFIEQFSKEKD